MAANGLFSTLHGDAAKWDQPDPDYVALLDNHVGGAAGTDRATCCCSLANIAQRSPVVVAFVLNNDEDFILGWCRRLHLPWGPAPAYRLQQPHGCSLW